MKNSIQMITAGTPAGAPQPYREVEIDWAQVRQFLRRYRLTMVLTFLATVLSGYAALSLYTEQYDVTTELLVKIGRENLDPPAISRNMPLSTGLRREELLSEVEILKSPSLLHQLVDKMGVEPFRVKRVPPPGLIARVKFEIKALVRGVKDRYQDLLVYLDLKKSLPEKEQVIQDLSERLVVDVRKDSDVVLLVLRYPDRQLGVRVLEEMVDLYLRRRIEVRRNSGVKSYLDGRAETLRTELNDADQEMVRWKKGKSLMSSPAEEKGVLMKQIQDLSLEIGQSSREIENLTRQVAAARDLSSSMPAFERTSEQTTPNPLVQSLREKIAGLEAERVQALAKYQPGSTAVRNIDDQLTAMRQMLASEKTTQPGAIVSNVNTSRQSLEQKLRHDSVRLAGLRATQSIQQKQLETLRSRMAVLDEAETVANAFERKRQMAEESLKSVLKRRSEAEVTEELDDNRISNVSVLTPPISTLVPVYPPKLIAMAIILAAGVALALVLSLLLHYSDNRVRNGRDLELDLGIAFLGEIGSATYKES